MLRRFTTLVVEVSSDGGSSSAFSVYKVCFFLLVLRWSALLLPAGHGGEGVEFKPNGQTWSERVRADRALGPAGRSKQTALSECVRAHPFWPQSWARNALVWTAGASLLFAPGPADKGTEPFPHPSPVLPCCSRPSFFPSLGPAWPPPVPTCCPNRKKALLSPLPEAT
jgi:hypothetical protein